MRKMGIGFVAAALSCGALNPASRGAEFNLPQEYELSGRFEHDRAAIYSVVSSAHPRAVEEFWILGCEMERGVGCTDTSSLAFRYFFQQLPAKPMKVGAVWALDETAFHGEAGDGVKPLKVSGQFRLKAVKKTKLSTYVGVAKKLLKDEKEEEYALIEGKLGVASGTWAGKVNVTFEGRPSAIIETFGLVRVSDGVIVGGRVSWSGRTQTYGGKLSAPVVGRGKDVKELLLKEWGVELTVSGLRRRIDFAVERGVAWLKKRQERSGKLSDTGYTGDTSAGLGATAMSVLALLHSGVAPSDRAVINGFQYLRSKRSKASYDLSLILMALEAKYVALAKEALKGGDAGDAQRRNWISKNVSRSDRVWGEQLVAELVQCQVQGGFGYRRSSPPNMSTTQYGVLGLRAAVGLGMKVPAGIWKDLVQYIVMKAVPANNETVIIKEYDEEAFGSTVASTGWGYDQKYSRASGSMTLAGLACLAICRGELNKAGQLGANESEQISQLGLGGVAWFQGNYNIRASTPEGISPIPAMVFYYLYGIERAMILWNIERVGEHDWYCEGAAVLLSWQGQDGSWVGPHGIGVADTAWALLFLKRATLPVETEHRPRVATGVVDR